MKIAPPVEIKTTNRAIRDGVILSGLVSIAFEIESNSFTEIDRESIFYFLHFHLKVYLLQPLGY